MDKIDGDDGSTLVTFTLPADGNASVNDTTTDDHAPQFGGQNSVVHVGPPARDLDSATSGADSTGSR